ncbi:hypothetical protein BDZ85DRAFT_253294 [Elsinoe ampelina]|uniref:Phytanoyl-CoA dioxygenase family protein n=1 Tax=Elsinoe ampelina TaxID=302913 RepID=A0A6A6FZV1_9PEZI|nr:hypothetical protein BDZ85DRAFT_253294 [Elsinoe ampelina]
MLFLGQDHGSGPVPSPSTTRLFDLSQKRRPNELKAIASRTLTTTDCPLAASVVKNVPMYDCSKLNIVDSSRREALMTELYNMLLHGPGVLVLKIMYTNHDLLDETNATFSNVIDSERTTSKGDHFFANNTNSRIWNSFSKHCLTSPSTFIPYYSNPFLALICEAYLGPAYRITTQLNIVHPGGTAQTCHRDYHLGFQTAEQVSRWPRAMHTASQLLTLQGAIAHTDMPLLSGPTRLLPFSQRLESGFMSYRDADFQSFFLEHHIALPLQKGYGLFFNPALYHAAGENKTAEFDRSANLVQVSSAFGKPMESIDTLPLVEKTWDGLKEKFDAEGMSQEVEAFVQAVAEGYPFPTNLDRRPPAHGGMAPESEQGLLRRALVDGWGRERVVGKLGRMREEGKA